MGTPPSTATVGTYYTYSFAAVGTTPLTWSLSGAPSWMTIDSNGVVSGNPNTSGSYPNIVVTVTNSGGTNTISFSLSVTGHERKMGRRIYNQDHKHNCMFRCRPSNYWNSLDDGNDQCQLQLPDHHHRPTLPCRFHFRRTGLADCQWRSDLWYSQCSRTLCKRCHHRL